MYRAPGLHSPPTCLLVTLLYPDPLGADEVGPYHLKFGDVYTQQATNIKSVADWRTSTNEAWLAKEGKTAVVRLAAIEAEEELMTKHGIVDVTAGSIALVCVLWATASYGYDRQSGNTPPGAETVPYGQGMMLLQYPRCQCH